MGNANALIKETVTSVIPGAEVILFGSRAKGTAHEHSDYDLLVITPDQLKKEVHIDAYCELHKKLVYLLDEGVDLIIKSKEAAEEEKQMLNFVVREAFKNGVKL
jgi:predicted nucleotidyltransferase